jgi:hypothetical protein
MKVSIWIPVICMIAVTSGTCFAAYSGGTGISSDPYQIADVNDLLYLAEHTGDYASAFVLTADINLAGHTFNTALIAADTGGNGGESFEGVTFKGIFDGNGHTIRNFQIDDLVGADYLGLFGYIQNAVIKNLGVEISIVATGYDYQSVNRGGLVGLNEGGTIENCWCDTFMQGGRYNIGGLVGEMGGGIINKCRAHTIIYINQWGSSCISGLVGRLENGTIENSSSSGSLFQGSGNTNMGGIAGIVVDGTIRNSHSSCSISGDDNLGGLVGNLFMFVTTPIVDKCYSTGAISGHEDVGGLIGKSTGAVTASFWDQQTSGRGSSAGGIPLYTSLMKTRSTFTNAGWDFNDIWTICEGTSYPRLVCEIPRGDFICPVGINFADFSILASAWMTQPGQPDWNSACDISNPKDDIIDWKDLDVFAENWLSEP